jgi:hypothetical protein
MAVMHTTGTLIAHAHREAMRISPAAGAALRDVLPPRLAAYVTGVDATRLRAAYEIVRLLEGAHEAPETIQAWFLGMNLVLEDRSPARVLHEGDQAGARRRSRLPRRGITLHAVPPPASPIFRVARGNDGPPVRRSGQGGWPCRGRAIPRRL